MSLFIYGMEMPKQNDALVVREINGKVYIKHEGHYGFEGRIVEVKEPHGRLIDATFEENHYASMLLDPTSDVTEQDKHKARIIIDALMMAGTVIEAERREE